MWNLWPLGSGPMVALCWPYAENAIYIRKYLLLEFKQAISLYTLPLYRCKYNEQCEIDDPKVQATEWGIVGHAWKIKYVLENFNNYSYLHVVQSIKSTQVTQWLLKTNNVHHQVTVKAHGPLVSNCDDCLHVDIDTVYIRWKCLLLI